MALAGVTTVRNFDAALAEDRLLPLTNAGMTVTGLLMWSPSSTLSLPVGDLNGWRQYVNDQVVRYKGRIKHWEVWNEPPNFTADKTPQSYAKIVAAAYDAAKAADPTVQIGLAAKSNHVNWLAQSIEAGAADKFDFITLHPYENIGLVLEGGEGQFMSIAPRVRKMLLDKNPAKAGVPVWFTEIGIQASPPASSGVLPEVQADVLTKIYTMSIAQGVARTYWFDPRDSEGLYHGLTTAAGTARPAYFAMQTLSAYLGTRPEYLGWLQPAGEYYAFAFAGTQGTVLSLWAPPGKTARLELSSPMKLIDPRSGAVTITQSVTITNRPILLVGTANSKQVQSWRTEAAANLNKPFPWNGDHSQVTSVSLTAGSQADGVVMSSPPAVTVVGGIAEYNITGQYGARFTVDPTFLSYSTTPIKITVRLRGLGTGDPGFNLKYESNAPMAQTDGNGLVSSSLGWHRVTGTTFYEKSWTISNPRFIGYYGYNFILDTDGPAHAQFSIQKITVSKI